MKTRQQAEERALELYPIHEEFDVDRLKELREAYLQGWDDSQVAMDAKQAADEVDRDKHTCGFCVEPKQHQKELLKEMMRKDEDSGFYELNKDDIEELDNSKKH